MKKVINNQISRRKIFPILGGGLLIPFLGLGNTPKKVLESDSDNKYEILLKPDGTTVKVKSSALKKSRSVKKNISNNSLYNWLSKKL